MERLSLQKAAANDRTAAVRLATLDSELSRLKTEQSNINGQWEGERREMMKVKVRRQWVLNGLAGREVKCELGLQGSRKCFHSLVQNFCSVSLL
jgi:uncharacterized protein YgiM (DUF1202 family)